MKPLLPRSRLQPVDRGDIAWALCPQRGERMIKARPLSHEEYTSGVTPASFLLHAVGHLITVAYAVLKMDTTAVDNATREEARRAQPSSETAARNRHLKPPRATAT